MSDAFPEPGHELSDPKLLLLLYLDFYRDVVTRKLAGLSDEQLRSAVLPSGWSPVQLLKHLVCMERRWLLWGFAAQDVPEPWGDHNAEDGCWRVPADENVADLLEALRAQAETTRLIVEGAGLDDFAGTGGRFTAQEKSPTLAWILFHVLGEYARHAGHLDVVRELIDGSTGE